MADEKDVDLTTEVKMDDATVTLAELAGLSMDEIAEKRGEAFPKGVYSWEVDTENPPHLAVYGEGDKKAGFAVFRLKCIEVIGVSDNEFKDDPNELVGKYHLENMRLGSADSLGYLKAFLVDIGAPAAPNLAQQLKGCAGVRFQGAITKKKDPNDSDKIYTNINRNKGKIRKMDSAAISEVARAVA